MSNEIKNEARRIILDNLPTKEGFGALKGKQVIDWINSVGHEVKFIYDDLEGNIKILEYNPKNYKLKLKYNDKIEYIGAGHFIYCKITKLLGIRNSTYIYNVGENIVSNNRNFTILDRKIENMVRKNGYVDCTRYYNYKCHICGSDKGWMRESVIKRGAACQCCSGNIVVPGINDIPTTEPWMVKYFQGGYEEAKKYTKHTREEIIPICPYCERVSTKKTKICNIFAANGFPCDCKNNISFPEKFMNNVLRLLGVNYVYHANKTILDWCKKKEYDFYIPSLNMIIETHGEQHYQDAFVRIKGAKTLKEQQKNDAYKENLAKNNGIDKYIVIDCRYSEAEWIKNNILNSDIANYFSFENFNWEKCIKQSYMNRNIEIWDYVNKNSHLTSSQIAEHFNMNKCTIRKIINKGMKLNLCCNTSYRKKIAEKTITREESFYSIYDEFDNLIGQYWSASHISDISMEILNTRICRQSIYDAVKNNKRCKKHLFVKETICVDVYENKTHLKTSSNYNNQQSA